LIFWSDKESERGPEWGILIEDYLGSGSPCFFNLDYWKNVDFSPIFRFE